jgi:hypothetical protein
MTMNKKWSDIQGINVFANSLKSYVDTQVNYKFYYQDQVPSVASQNK